MIVNNLSTYIAGVDFDDLEAIIDFIDSIPKGVLPNKSKWLSIMYKERRGRLN